MTLELVIACGFSGNVENILLPDVPHDVIPAGVEHNKVPGCIISPSPEGSETRYEVTLPRGDKLQIGPCVPHTRYAGSSINIGAMAKTLGHRVHCWITLDTDPHGRGMFRSLDTRGIRVNCIPCGSTPLTLGIRGGGATTLLMQKPAPPQFILPEQAIHQIATGITLCQPNIFFATSIGEVELSCVQTAFERLEQTFCVFCPRISILGKEHHEKGLLKAMASADAVFMNRREYRHLTDDEFASDEAFSSREHIVYAVKMLAPYITDARQRLFVVTCDTDGASAVAHRNGNTEGIHDVQAIPITPVVDTTGAGDAFALGMTIALCRGIPWQTAMEWGTKLAAENVKGPGGWFAADTKNNPLVITPAFFDPPTT